MIKECAIMLLIILSCGCCDTVCIHDVEIVDKYNETHIETSYALVGKIAAPMHYTVVEHYIVTDCETYRCYREVEDKVVIGDSYDLVINCFDMVIEVG